MTYRALERLGRRWVQENSGCAGIEVRLTPWYVAGSLRKVGDTLFLTVDSRQSAAARRWALAHELGHLIASHSVELAYRGCSETEIQRMEDEADAIAFLLTGLNREGN